MEYVIKNTLFLILNNVKCVIMLHRREKLNMSFVSRLSILYNLKEMQSHSPIHHLSKLRLDIDHKQP